MRLRVSVLVSVSVQERRKPTTKSENNIVAFGHQTNFKTNKTPQCGYGFLSSVSGFLFFSWLIDTALAVAHVLYPTLLTQHSFGTTLFYHHTRLSPHSFGFRSCCRHYNLHPHSFITTVYTFIPLLVATTLVYRYGPHWQHPIYYYPYIVIISNTWYVLIVSLRSLPRHSCIFLRRHPTSSILIYILIVFYIVTLVYIIKVITAASWLISMSRSSSLSIHCTQL